MRTCQCMSHFVYNLRSRLVRDLAARVRGQIASDHCRSDLITGRTHWARAGYPFPEVNLPEINLHYVPGRDVPVADALSGAISDESEGLQADENSRATLHLEEEFGQRSSH